jgi:hypothetical protein
VRTVEHSAVVYDDHSCVRDGRDPRREEEDTRFRVPDRYGTGSVDKQARGSGDAEHAQTKRRC